MRISAQNNQFIFNLPLDIVSKHLDEQFSTIMEKNFIPYSDIISYINSTIKEITFPGLSFSNVEQRLMRGKVRNYKESGNIHDKFVHDLDINFRSVDSHLNYFMMVQILTNHYLDTKELYIPDFSIQVLDKDGILVYTILFKEIILKSISELRMSYQMQDISEKTFTVQFSYNFIDIIWELTDSKYGVGVSIFDLPIELPNDRKVDTEKDHRKSDEYPNITKINNETKDYDGFNKIHYNDGDLNGKDSFKKDGGNNNFDDFYNNTFLKK